jgi:hypothetical protein
MTLVSLVQDLTNLGYRWPQLVKEDLKQHDEALPSIENTGTWEPIIPTLFQRLPDVTLIVMYNTPVPAAVPQIVQRLYQPVSGQVWLPSCTLSRLKCMCHKAQGILECYGDVQRTDTKHHVSYSRRASLGYRTNLSSVRQKGQCRPS